MNNLWSALNNFKSGGEEGRAEAARSVFLAVFSITENFKTFIENSKSPTIRKWGGVVSHLTEAAILGDRLNENLNKYWDYRDFNEKFDTNNNQATYNKGLIPVTNILDIKSDIVALSKKVLDIIDVLDSVTGKIVTPYSIALDVVAVLITAVSNSIGTRVLNHQKLMELDKQYSHLTDDEKKALHQKWLDENHSIHKDEFSFGELFGEAVIEALTSWSTVTALLEEVLDGIVPDGLNPFATPNDVDLLGTNENDVIDADSWFDDAYRIFGNDGNDKLVGGNHNDYIDGGKGNDTLIGNEGSDQFIDEQGYDTYHITDADTIFDADGKGRIMFDGKALPHFFAEKEGASGIWEAKNSSKEVLFTAMRVGNDLTIHDTKAPNTATIKDFFKTATQSGTTYSALSIVLGDSQEDIDKFGVYTIKTDDKLLSAIYTGGFTGKKLNIIGSDNVDNIFGGGESSIDANTGGGDDLLFGSNTSDRLNGGADFDVMSGSAAFYDFLSSTDSRLPKEDKDILIGGTGSDLISGGVDNDILWAEDEYIIDEKTPVHLDPKNPNNTHVNGKGDWALGGRGSDTLHGSGNQDFLQGGADNDTVYGGGGDDVILGDGHIYFGQKSHTEFNLTTVSLQTGSHGQSIHPLVRGGSTVSPVVKPGEIVLTEYKFINGKEDQKKQPFVHYRDPATFKWQLDVNDERDDYTIKSHEPISLTYNHHILPSQYSTNTNDHLYGSAGNDLLIGQYGNDYLEGGEHNDTLYGDDNRDASIQGDDTLVGGKGQDKLIGGLGMDTYQFALSDLQSQADNKTITDSDNLGKIIIEGRDLTDVEFFKEKEGSNTYTTEDKRFSINNQGGSYVLSSKEFGATITIKGGGQSPLGMILSDEIQNTAPVVKQAIDDITVPASSAINLNLANTFFDVEDTDLQYTLQGAEGLHFDTTTKTLTGTAPDKGKLSVTVTATDSKGLSINDSFDITINQKPILNGNLQLPSTLTTNDKTQTIAIETLFNDPEGDKLSYTLEAPQGISLDDAGNLIINPAATQIGRHTITLTATDLLGQSISTTAQLELQKAPSIDPTLTEPIHVEPPKEPQTPPTNPIQIDPTPVRPVPYKPEAKGGNQFGGIGNDTLEGNNLANTLSGNFGNDTLIGHWGNDRLEGGWGRDTLIGGKDNDTLLGGLGNDTYLYTKGDGQDTITDAGGKDTLKLNNLTLSDLGFTKSGDDLNILIKNTTDSITIDGYFEKASSGRGFFGKLMSNINSKVNSNTIENIDIDGQTLHYQEVQKLVMENHQGVI